jgi:hypothetical protein
MPPSRNYIRSIPLQIDKLDAEMGEVFKGIALYNNGTISLAYRLPIIIESLQIGDRMHMAAQRIGVAADTRISFIVRAQLPVDE